MQMQDLASKYAHINGWGIDADPRNEPNYPMKHYTGDDHKGLNYERPTQQSIDVEVLHSNERPSVSAVFGNTLPPSGLSGAIRRLAFKFTESEYGHWLPLLLADRVNVLEGILDDLKNGHIPNFFAEWGWDVHSKEDRRQIAIKVAIAAAILAGVAVYLSRKKKNRARLTF